MLSDQELSAIRANLFPGAHYALATLPASSWHRDRSKAVTATRPHSSQAIALDLFATISLLESRDSIVEAWAAELRLPELGSVTIEPESVMAAELLGESRSTQVDAVIRGTKSTALVECKFTEPDGGSCSQTRRRKLIDGTMAPQCSGSYVEQANPVAPSGSATALCALTAKGIRYWELIPSVFHLASDVVHKPCPFARGEYQWMRNLVAAKALALQTGRPHSFVIAYVDGPFPMPRKLQTDEWREFRSRVREEVSIATISFQRLIAVARSASRERDHSTLDALSNWVDKKVERSLPNNRLQPSATGAMRSRRG